MSTSLLYHMFGIRGYEYRRVDYHEGSACFTIEQPRERYRCSECGSPAAHAQGHKDRFLQTVPIGLKPTCIFLKVARVICFQCEHTRQVKVPFADPRRTYTHSFERYAWELSKVTTIQDTALHLGVSWDIIKDIQKRNLHRRFGKPKLKNLKEIAIDEIAIGKGHAYFTVVLDLRSGAVVYVGDGKGADALTAFWKRLRASHAKVKAVATDMSKAYIAAVRKYLPSSFAISSHTGVPCFFRASAICCDSLTGTRGSFLPAMTNMGFLIFSILFMGAIFSRYSRIFGSRSSPYSTRRKSRR